MPTKFHFIVPLLACLLAACQSVRTVYDEGGNVVKPDGDGATETDLFSAYEKRFNESFSEKKNKEGVPETTSHRVSGFQKELDNARKLDTPYSTKAFGGVEESDASHKLFGGTKVYNANKEYGGSGVQSAITRDMRPDFMNGNRGLAHKDYVGGLTERSSSEGTHADMFSGTYSTNESRYRREQESGYFESHRNDTPAPPIIDHRSQQTKEIMNVRNILGRDKTDAE